MENQDAGLDALDLMTVLLSYISLHSYEENMKQTKKLDTIAFDMEHKLNYQNNMLREILKKVEDIKDGNKEIY